MTTYGSKPQYLYNRIFTMHLVFLWLVICISLSCQVLAEVEFYPEFRRPNVRSVVPLDQDVTPEDYVIEQLARRLFEEEQQQLERNRLYNTENKNVDQGGFSFRFPSETRPVPEEEPFAVGPSDPRYYQDTRAGDEPQYYEDSSGPAQARDYQDSGVRPESDVTANLVPRESKSDEDLPVVRLDEAVKSVEDLPLGAQHEKLPLGGDAAAADNEEIRLGNRGPPQPQSHVFQTPIHAGQDDKSDIYFIAIVAGCSAAAVVGIVIIGIFWYKLQKNTKAAADVEYPAYGVTGPNKEISPTGDRRLAQSAQMYHYQHQKQQIIAMENRVTNERNGSLSEAESEEENEEGDYTVYECPGLAATGEMEVKNPLFQDDPTPATPAPPGTQTKDQSSNQDIK